MDAGLLLELAQALLWSLLVATGCLCWGIGGAFGIKALAERWGR